MSLGIALCKILNTRECHNHYLYKFYLYWHIKLLMDRVLVDRHESKDNIMQNLDELKKFLLDVEGRLQCLELG